MSEDKDLWVRTKALRAIHQNPNITTRELAKIAGISNGSAFYCLKGLIDKGWVKARNYSQSNNKAKYLYILTPSGIKQKVKLTFAYLERRKHEYEELKVEIEVLQGELRNEKDRGMMHE